MAFYCRKSLYLFLYGLHIIRSMPTLYGAKFSRCFSAMHHMSPKYLYTLVTKKSQSRSVTIKTCGAMNCINKYHCSFCVSNFNYFFYRLIVPKHYTHNSMQQFCFLQLLFQNLQIELTCICIKSLKLLYNSILATSTI